MRPMRELRVLSARIRALFAQRGANREFDDELQQHLQLLTDRFVSQGMSRKDAADAARRQFGNRTLVRERHREARGFLFFGVLGRDLQFAARLLWKSPGFTAVAVFHWRWPLARIRPSFRWRDSC